MISRFDYFQWFPPLIIERVWTLIHAGNRTSVICRFADQVSVLLQFSLPVLYISGSLIVYHASNLFGGCSGEAGCEVLCWKGKFRHIELCHLAPARMQQVEPRVTNISNGLTYVEQYAAALRDIKAGNIAPDGRVTGHLVWALGAFAFVGSFNVLVIYLIRPVFRQHNLTGAIHCEV